MDKKKNALSEFWTKKSKKEKTSFIVKTCLWVLAIAFLFIVLFGKQIFGSSFDLFGEDNGFKAIGGWFVNNSYNFIKSLVIIIATIAVTEILKLIVRACSIKGKKAKTVASLINSLLKYLAIILCIFFVLGTWGVDTGTLLASLGIISLIIGLGCQSLINDIVAGLFLVFDNAYEVGDIVVIDDFRGTVTDLGLKTTKITDAGGNIKVINNSEIKTIVNLTDDLSTAITTCDVDYGEDLHRVEAVIAKNLPTIQKDIPAIIEGPYYKGVDVMADSGITLKFVAKCKEDDRYQVVRDLNREILLMFNANNVNIPFPQIVVNKPGEFATATQKEVNASNKFVDEQKELSKGIEKENNV